MVQQPLIMLIVNQSQRSEKVLWYSNLNSAVKGVTHPLSQVARASSFISQSYMSVSPMEGTHAII
jgi:hypothetical protein